MYSNMETDFSETHDYANSSVAKEFATQILRIPELMEFKHKHELLLFRSLYFLLSDHGKYYPYFWEVDGFWSYPENWDEVNELSFHKTFHADQKSCPTPGHIGHICAKTIEPGEMVYNCADCGTDNTCCLCKECFRKEDHADHNVIAHRSTGQAICDCGDESSWKVQLDCPANQAAKEHKKRFSELPQGLKSRISILVRVLFDFIINVGVTNLHSLPDSAFKFKSEDMDKQKFLEKLSQIDNLPQYPSLEKTMYKNEFKDYEGDYEEGVTFINDQLDYYHLVVWNDEFHNYQEATSFFSMVFGRHAQIPRDENNENAPFYEVGYLNYVRFGMDDLVTGHTKSVDYYGISSIKQSKDKAYLLELMQKYTKFPDKLSMSVMTHKELVNLSLCRSILVWFKYILKNENTVLTDFIKEQITETLLDPAQLHLQSIPLLSELDFSTCHLTPELSIPVLNDSLKSDDKKYTPIENFSLNYKTVTANSPSSFSRLQYLMFFELRYPKDTRVRLKDTIISILTNTSKSRFEFGNQILMKLPIFEFNTISYDREWQLTMLQTFRLQIYHDPNIGTSFLKMGRFEEILDSLINISLHASIIKNEKLNLNTGKEWFHLRTKTVFEELLQGLEIFLSFIHKGEYSIFNAKVVFKILRLFTIFEDIFQMKREDKEHVVVQDEGLCMLYYSFSNHIYNITGHLGKICSGIDTPNADVEKFIILLSSYLKGKERKYNEYGVLFDIQTEKISILHPVVCLLGEMMRCYKFFDSKLLLSSLSVVEYNVDGTPFFTVDSSSQLSDKIVGIADEALIPWCLYDQIKTKFWIRNGLSASLARSYFFELKPECNLFVIQNILMLGKLPIEEILDRYMINSCVFGDMSFTETIYEEKMPLLLTEFVTTMYYILTFRQFHDSSLSFEKIEELYKEYLIANTLAPAPLRFSQLKRKLSVDNFEYLLEKVAKYIPPTSHNDYGRYTLNDEYWGIIDPHTFIKAESKTGAFDVQESIIKHLAEIKRMKPEDIVITPYLYPLEGNDLAKFKAVGEFMKSNKFAKLLFKILKYAVDTGNDTHLSITLHLIHAIIMDDELYHTGNEHGLNNIINIPISNLLLTVYEKTENESFIKKKASKVLDLLLLKDSEVLSSLISCFGETRITDYQNQQKDASLESSLAKKKRLALKRQKKALKRMRKQQDAFAEQNESKVSANDEGNFTKDHDPVSQSISTCEKKNCILCLNPESEDTLFGTPCFISTSSVFWQIPTVADKAPNIVAPTLGSFTTGKNDAKSGCTREKLVVSGCPHGMHFSCFEAMLRRKNMKIDDYQCPLCKNTSNMFLPAFKSREIELDPNFSTASFEGLLKIEKSTSNNVSYLRSIMFEPSLNKVLSSANSESFVQLQKEINILRNQNTLFDRFMRLFVQYQYNIKRYLPIAIALTVGSTIEKEEITSRESKEINMPDVNIAVLKSMIQYRLFLDKTALNEMAGSESTLLLLISNSNFGFLETLFLTYLESDLSFADSIKLSLLKNVITTAKALFERADANVDNLNLYDFVGFIGTLSNVSYKSLDDILTLSCPKAVKNDTRLSREKLIKTIYAVLQKNFANYKRQVDYSCLLFEVLPPLNNSHLVPSLDDLLRNALDSSTFEHSIIKWFAENIPSKEDSIKKGSVLMNHLHIRDEKMAIIDNPNSPRLITLPKKLKDLIIKPIETVEKKKVSATPLDAQIHQFKMLSETVNQSFRYSDEEVEGKLTKQNHQEEDTHLTYCLHCGEKMKNIIYHLKQCKVASFSALYFTPSLNILRLQLHPAVSKNIFFLESPYFNNRGEPSKGVLGQGDSGTLNEARYEYLRKSYFDQTLIVDKLRGNGYRVKQQLEVDEVPGIYEGSRDRFAAAIQKSIDAPDNELQPTNGLTSFFRNILGGQPMAFPVMQNDDDDDDDSDNDNDPDARNTIVTAEDLRRILEQNGGNAFTGQFQRFAGFGNIEETDNESEQEAIDDEQNEPDFDDFNPRQADFREFDSEQGTNFEAENGEDDDNDGANDPPRIDMMSRLAAALGYNSNGGNDGPDEDSNSDEDPDYESEGPESDDFEDANLELEADDDDDEENDINNDDDDSDMYDESFDGRYRVGRMVSDGHVWGLWRLPDGSQIPEYEGETDFSDDGIYFGA